MKKKYLVLFIIMCFMLSLNTSYAMNLESFNNINKDYLSIDDNEIKPTVVDACPGYGRHDMVSRGWGTLIRVNKNGSKKTLFKNGTCWQCSRCKEVLVAQYDPKIYKTAGYYCMRNPGYVINITGLTMEARPEAIKYASGNKIPHCILRYAPY